MGVGRESRRGGCIGEIVKCWYRMTCLDPEQPGKNSVTDDRRYDITIYLLTAIGLSPGGSNTHLDTNNT